jgi:hypothetical protein
MAGDTPAPSLMAAIRHAQAEQATARLAYATVVGMHERTHPSDDALIARFWRAEDWLLQQLAEVDAILTTLSERHLEAFGMPLRTRAEIVALPDAVAALVGRALGARIEPPTPTSAARH